MHPSTLSAADFDCGMYVLVLCPSQNPLLSRIWAHLPPLAGNRGIRFRASGAFLCAGKKSEGMPHSKIPAFAHLDPSRAPGRKTVPLAGNRSIRFRVSGHIFRAWPPLFFYPPFSKAGDHPQGWWWVSSHRLRFSFQKTAVRFSSFGQRPVTRGQRLMRLPWQPHPML
jgi:hypothetical protein